MPEPLKNRYNDAFFKSLTNVLCKVYPAFDKKKFLSFVFDDEWTDKELKARMRHVTSCLHSCLPEYKQAIPILKAVASHFHNTFEHMFFPDYVECYGLDEYETSIDALEHFTKYSSSEFAVRPFIIQYPEKMMRQMKDWAEHDNEHVRRLASEGCRPRLPWAMQLPAFIQNPTAVLEVLEKLKFDESLYVRRSAANNLNDIAKDNPEIVYQIAKAWLGQNKETDWLVKHACRTLLKQAHPKTLLLFGFTAIDHINIKDFKVDPAVVWDGKVAFSATIHSKEKLGKLGKLRLEFAIDFMKANQKTSKKVFKIAESTYQTSQKEIQKTFNFKPISTRKYYAGEHQLSLIINGKAVAKKPFILLASADEKAGVQTRL
ncbi:MAG: DNA alkylation repair protein [Ghiorsea sp.]